MEVIVLFDTDKLPNCYRTFKLGETVAEALRLGKRVSLTVCHPDHGEVFITEICEDG